MGRLGQAVMYGLGNTIPTEWPQRADTSIYEKYARLPSWHIEEAASLVAGFKPRVDTRFCPLDGKPGTTDQPDPPPPYEGAVTWNALLRGEIGNVISLYARHKRVLDWNFSGDALYVGPKEFVEFCAQYGISTPPDLTEFVCQTAVKPAMESPKQLGKALEANNHPTGDKEATYRVVIFRLAQELAGLAKGHKGRLTVQQLQALVESESDCRRLNVDTRTFERYLAKLREEKSMRSLLTKILRGTRGRPNEDDKDDVMRWLPPKYSEALRL